MANCLVAQSGGPTTVINASLAGVVRANQLNPVYEHVFGGLNGIEGILQDRLYDLTNMSEYENRVLRQTPSSALGSCRYKLKRNDETDYRKLVEIMDKHDIEIMFYIGGNDSMDTVDALSQWAKANNVAKRFVGIPKTVDNDLMVIDHCPGFAGWLAGSTVVTGRVDLVILPEINFDKDVFLAQVKKCMDETGYCYVVTSEGAHYADGTYVAAGESKNDLFGHAVLGGAASVLKQMILDAGVASRVKVQDLSTAARSSNFAQSLVDVTEAFELGMSAHMRSADPTFTGMVVAHQRETIDGRYNAKFIASPAENFANYVKHVPVEWIKPNYEGLTQEFYDYITPLIQGEPTLIMENGIPATVVPYNMR